MIRKSKGKIEWLQFEILEQFPELSHAVFLNTLNFAQLKDLPKVEGILALEAYAHSFQQHGDHVEWVSVPSRIEDCDGLITREKGLGLAIKHADCQAAIFYDPVTRTLANVHSGWRGSAKNIYGKTIKHLVDAGVKPENLIVCISPSLGPEAAEFKHYYRELPKAFHAFQVKPTYCDFWAISRMQLESEGILAKHIEFASICTYNHPQDFFSYRRDHDKQRHATIVGLR